MNRQTLRVIHAKTKGRCWYCGRSIHPLDDWQVEHQIPRVQGGTDHINNLVPACRECNAAKGKRNVEEYRRSLLVKLENLITQAYEMTGDIEGKVAWDRQPDEDALFIPPGWLCKISYLLHQAATDTVNAECLFYGERMALEAVEVERLPVQQTETVA